MKRWIKKSLVGYLVVIAGCQLESSDPESQPSPSAGMFEHVSMDLQRGYKNAYRHFQIHDEHFWCYTESTSNEIQSVNPGSGWAIGADVSLVCRDQDSIVFTYAPTEQEYLVDMLIQSSGHILVATATLNYHDEMNFYELKLRQFDAAGNPVQVYTLVDQPAENEVMYYLYDNDRYDTEDYASLLVQNNKPQLFSNAVVQLYEHNHQVYLLAMTYGLKLYQFDQSLNMTWDTQLFPLTAPMVTSVFASGNDSMVRMALNDQNKIAVVYQLDNAYIDVFEQHFGQSLTAVSDGIDLLLQQFSDNGVRQTAVMTGAPDVHDNLVDILWQNDQLRVIGNGRYQKANAAGGTTEWDIYSLTVTPETGEINTQQVIDIDQEDKAYAAQIMDGELYIAGHSGFVQVDTNSVVENGYGVIVKIDNQQQITPVMELSVPRDSQVTGLTTWNGSLFYRYIYDAPITHTCDNGELLCYNKAGIGWL